MRAHYFWAVCTEKQRIDKVSYQRLCIKEFTFFDLRENLSPRRNQQVSYSYLGQLLFCKGKEQFFSEFSPFIPGKELHRHQKSM